MTAWMRVRDTATGHQYDIPATDTLRDGIEPVKREPVLDGPGARPRPAKHRVPLGTRTNSRKPRGSRTGDTNTEVPGQPADSKE